MESGTTIELEFQKVMPEKVAVVNGVGPNTIKEVSNNYVDTVESISRSTDKSGGQVVDSSAKVNEDSVTVPGIKVSNSVEKLGSDGDIGLEEAQKDQGGHNGNSNEPQKKKACSCVVSFRRLSWGQ